MLPSVQHFDICRAFLNTFSLNFHNNLARHIIFHFQTRKWRSISLRALHKAHTMKWLRWLGHYSREPWALECAISVLASGSDLFLNRDQAFTPLHQCLPRLNWSSLTLVFHKFFYNYVLKKKKNPWLEKLKVLHASVSPLRVTVPKDTAQTAVLHKKRASCSHGPPLSFVEPTTSKTILTSEFFSCAAHINILHSSQQQLNQRN